MGTLGHALRLVIACGLCAMLGGCFLSELLARITVSSIAGLVDTTIELVWGGGTAAVCLSGSAPGPAAPELVTAVTCTYIVNGEIVASTASLVSEFGLVGALIDPVVVQVPAAATAFSGTFTGPAGGTQALQITEVVGTLRADVSTNIVAQPGTKLVIVDFPANPPTNTSYSFTLQFRLPGDVPTIPVKALFAAKVTVAGQSYYPPLLPCETDFANVPGVDLPQSATFQAVTVPSPAGRGCAGRVYQFNPGAIPDLNQHGLTGSWYEPATNGQGFEVEVFPDLVAPGTGGVQMSWFTFDTVVGGADRQRWYTLSGNMVSGQPSASLTIYRNTGGNFNALPVTDGVVVGTATLSFSTCTSGLLAYTFTDGSGRTGSIPLTRITQNVTCSTTSARPTNADFAFSGNWFNATTSGQGFVAEVNPNNGSVFVPWYTYAPGGAGAGAAGQRWYTASGAFTPGSRSIALRVSETTRGVFDTPTVPAASSVEVGSATLAFQSCSTATFVYNFTGGTSSGASGTINLTRIGPIPAGCVL